MDYAERYDRWQNLPQMFFEKADERGAAAMFWAKRYDAWQPVSWHDARDTVSAISRGLRRLGVERGDRVMLEQVASFEPAL
ncbi:MAG: hypothetical protein HN420_15395, partial [Rhodospirillaceae bacterium]|nr:hypothetical protein [Rhodospirillaceae bacterium]